LDKPRWLVEPEKKITKRQLKELCNEWQHLLGLCDYGIKVELVKDWKACSSMFVTYKYVVIKACDERTLLHELLHVLLNTKNTFTRILGKRIAADKKEILRLLDEGIIFQLVNALLHLKYGE